VSCCGAVSFPHTLRCAALLLCCPSDVSQGQGLKRDLTLPAAYSQWRAYDCPKGTVGATDITPSTASAVVCRAISEQCGRGYHYSAYGNECYNPAGFGAYEQEVIECPIGSWAEMR
jgi:hypothetical protein